MSKRSEIPEQQEAHDLNAAFSWERFTNEETDVRPATEDEFVASVMFNMAQVNGRLVQNWSRDGLGQRQGARHLTAESGQVGAAAKVAQRGIWNLP